MKSLAVAVFAMLFIACTWSAMTGGLKDVAVEDPGVVNAANWAVNRHIMTQNDAYRRNMVKVVKAQSQLVAGMKYIITVNMTRMSCTKNTAIEDCGSEQKYYDCTFTVWSKPWLSEIHLLKETCTDDNTSN